MHPFPTKLPSHPGCHLTLSRVPCRGPTFLSTHLLPLCSFPAIVSSTTVTVCVCVFSPFSCVQLFADPWTVAHQAPLVHGICQARILEWVAISFSRGSSRPRDWIRLSSVSCIGRQILYHEHYLGSPFLWFIFPQITLNEELNIFPFIELISARLTE